MPKALSEYLTAAAAHDVDAHAAAVPALLSYVERRPEVSMWAWVEEFTRSVRDESIWTEPPPVFKGDVPKMNLKDDTRQDPVYQLLLGCHEADPERVIEAVGALTTLVAQGWLPHCVTYSCEAFMEKLQARSDRGAQP